VRKKKVSKEHEYKQVLIRISNLGVGIKEDMRDYSNIGKSAIYFAQQALAEKCKTCGKTK
jgi:hypothetical protein